MRRYPAFFCAFCLIQVLAQASGGQPLCKANPARLTPAECLCQGDGYADRPTLRGGDGFPLRWSSAVYLVKAVTEGSPPTHCFDVSVANHSDLDVWDIRWQEANYKRKKIPPHCLRATCSYYDDFASEEIANGYLYYGVSDDPYDASTYVPDSGWDHVASEHASVESLGANDEEAKTALTTIMDVDVPSIDSSKYSLSRIQITSFVSDDNGIVYEFRNEGENPVYVFLNVSKTQDFIGEFHSFDDPLFLKGFGQVKTYVGVSEPITSESASLIVWSEAKELVGIGSAGVYGMRFGEKDIEPADIWYKVD